MAQLLLEGGDDAGATVRAALAFIDECDHELARFPKSSPPSPPPSRRPGRSPDKKPTTGGARNPSRDKKKLELAALRAQVTELSARLAQLQMRKRGDGRCNSNDGPGSCDVKEDLRLVWRDIARRHRQRRVQAGEENAELRAAVQRQTEAIQLLRKMLIKQTQVDRPMVSREYQPHAANGRAPPRDVVEELLRSLSRPMADQNLLLRPRLQVLQVSPTQTQLTLVESRYIPFGANASAGVLWSRVDKPCLVHRVHFKQLMQTPEQTFMRSYSAHLQCEDVTIKSSGHQAGRLFSTDGSVAIAYASVEAPSEIGGWRSASGVKISEKGWITLAPTASGSTTSGPPSELTLMQIQWDVTLDVPLDVPERNRCQKALIHAMTRHRAQHLDCTQQQIEDELLTPSVRPHAFGWAH